MAQRYKFSIESKRLPPSLSGEPYFLLVLVEKDIVPENLQDLPLISNGFHKPITVTDFPVRDHTMYFRIKRRRWLDKSTGKSYSRDWNLVASGTRITAEFGAFLKELP